MKKIMFATALVASAAAFADPLNAISFEGYTLGQGPVVDGYEKLDAGGNASNLYFFYTNSSAGTDSSFVTNHAAGTTFTSRPAYYAESGTDSNYLSLDTEGGTLWRSIDDTNNGVDLGDARPVADTGTYLDTLVQFTVTEDEAPTVGEGDKLAIWLQAGEGTTNLMVKAGVIDDQSGITPTTFTLNAKVNPGEWYRLTVKALADITDGEGIIGFQIYLDGTLLTSSTPTLTSEYLDILGPDDMNDSHYADLVAGKYFASIIQVDELQGVGFQGTGAVDEIVWTEDNPFPAEAIEFTLTYSGDANTTLGAVTYTIGDDPTVQTPTEGKIPDGATVSIAAPTFAPGYQLAAFTVDGTAETVASWPYTFTMTANKTVSITSAIMTFTLTVPTVEHATATVTVGGQAASGNTFNYGTVVDVVWAADNGYQITANGTQQFTMTSDQSVVAPTVEAVATYPSYLTNADATIKGKYDAWKQTYQADTDSQWENAFLLNMDPATSVAEGTALLKIASITEVSGGWELEIASDATTLTAETNNDGLVGNGYLAITYAADLATLTSGGTTVNLPVTVTNGKIKVTVSAPGAKFMKAKLTTAAEPAGE